MSFPAKTSVTRDTGAPASVHTCSNPSGRRHPLVWICGLALVARIVAMLLPLPVDYDTVFYRTIATHLLAGHGYTYDGVKPETYWMPGAVFLHALAQLVHPDLKAAQILWVFLGVGMVAISFGMARNWFGRRVAVVFATLMAVYPYNLIWGNYATTEIPNLMLLMATAWLLMARASPMLIGACLGCACLFRAPDLAYLPLVVLAAMWQSGDWAARIRRGALILLAFAACIAPWTLRTSACAGTFVPLSTGGLKNAWMGTNPWYVAWVRGDIGAAEFSARIFKDCNPSTAAFAEQNRVFRGAIVDFVQSDPGGFVSLMGYKTFRFFLVPPGWTHSHTGSKLVTHFGGRGRWLVWAAGAIYLLVVAGAAAALWRVGRLRCLVLLGPLLLWILFAYAANVWFDAVVAYRYKSGAETCLLLLAAWYLASRAEPPIPPHRAGRQNPATTKSRPVCLPPNKANDTGSH